MRMWTRSVFGCLLIGTFVQFAHADEPRTLYLEAEKGRLFTAASFKSKVLAELKTGDAVIEIEINAPWARVKFEGQEGYMPAYNLTAVKP